MHFASCRSIKIIPAYSNNLPTVVLTVMRVALITPTMCATLTFAAL